jgi:hypothetical protein
MIGTTLAFYFISDFNTIGLFVIIQRQIILYRVLDEKIIELIPHLSKPPKKSETFQTPKNGVNGNFTKTSVVVSPTNPKLQ